MKNIAFPYPTLFPFIPKESKWQSLINLESPREFKYGSGNWDYDSSLEISCQLSWDIQNVYSEANLLSIIDSSKLAFVLSSGQSEQTGKREKLAEYKLSEITNKKDPFLLKIPSKLQSSKLKIKLLVYTDEVEINTFKIKSGSILYMEEATLLLEGDLANFAVRRKDLNKYGCADALWFVEFQADNLNETFTTTTTLYLNNKKPDFVKQLQSDHFLIHLIKSDVITTVLSSILLGEDDFQLDFSSEYPEDSLGKIVSDWLSSLNVKKESDLQNIRYQLINEQGIFRSRCQNLASSKEEE
tara:strand:- start:941 stop:1837 length:897 start_codon:yes stop_codon:yes gene_type:complete